MEQGIFWRNQGILPREQRNSLRKQAIEECGLVGRGENVCVHVDGRAARRLPARCRSCSAWEWGSARKPHVPFDLPSRRLVDPFARHGDCDHEGVDRAIVSGES